MNKLFVSMLLVALPTSVMAADAQVPFPNPPPTKEITPKIIYPADMDRIMSIQKTRITGVSYSTSSLITLELVYTPAITCKYLLGNIEVKDGDGVIVGGSDNAVVIYDKLEAGKKRKSSMRIIMNGDVEQVVEINFNSMTCSQ